uniref:CCHC-type domain-containing protein n=1 Tax=Wuchereria bancrofti TaxID=6293 RepID=A0AAF5PMW3_WUCBA
MIEDKRGILNLISEGKEKNDREWKVTVEATERILRQLEAMGENLEQSSIEIIIENKLPLDSGQKRRMQRLKEKNACLNCLQPGHTTINCKTRKRVCFYCKGHHNTALCYTKYNDQTQSVGLIEEEKIQRRQR